MLVHYSGYTEEDIQPAVDAMIEYLQAPTVHQAFYRKYAGKKFLKGTPIFPTAIQLYHLTVHSASLHARQWAKEQAVKPDALQ